MCHLAKNHNSTSNLMTFEISDPRSKSFTSTWEEFLGGEHPVPYIHTKRKIAHVFIQAYQ